MEFSAAALSGGEQFHYDGTSLICVTCGASSPVRPPRHKDGCLAVVGVAGLSKTQKAIALLVADGCSAKEIAARLHLGRTTVEGHKFNIYARLGIRGIASLTRKVIEYERTLP